MLEGTLKLVDGSQRIAVQITGLLFTLSFIAFVVVAISFLLKRRSGDGKGLEQAKDMLWWSVFAMFVLMAVWGIVAFLSQNLGIGVGGCVDKPSAIPGQAPTSANCGGSKRVNGTGVGSDVFDPNTKEIQGCYAKTNTQCRADPSCKIDSLDGCVPK